MVLFGGNITNVLIGQYELKYKNNGQEISPPIVYGPVRGCFHEWTKILHPCAERANSTIIEIEFHDPRGLLFPVRNALRHFFRGQGQMRTEDLAEILLNFIRGESKREYFRQIII